MDANNNPTTFTDEELGNLKKWVELDMPKTPGYFDWSFPALLARLENAEKALEDNRSGDGHIET